MFCRLGCLVLIEGDVQLHKPAHFFGRHHCVLFLGGDLILINLVHESGNICALMGKIIAVQAMGSLVIRNCAVEDSVVNTFFSANGAAVKFVLSDAAAAPLDWEQTSKENRIYPT